MLLDGFVECRVPGAIPNDLVEKVIGRVKPLADSIDKLSDVLCVFGALTKADGERLFKDQLGRRARRRRYVLDDVLTTGSEWPFEVLEVQALDGLFDVD